MTHESNLPNGAAIVSLTVLSNLMAWWAVPENAALVNHAVGTIAGLCAIGLGVYRVIRIIKGHGREL